ncbi:acetyltransferase [Halomonas sp. RA08-2]|uniref:acetyltransferase n=1 Tax=Halomonas sp. RA08-2 TaxID=3440842 RepID=UPI003EE870DC
MKLAILGASGHGKVVADTALQAGWQEVVFFDDAWPELTENSAWSVVGDSARLIERLAEFDGVSVGIGNNRIRLAKARELMAAGAAMPNIVHPSAMVSPLATLGAGCVIFAGAVIQVDSRLGQACIVNTNASVDHDCQLADGVHICPGIAVAGLVIIGECSWIGIGASVKQLVRIGRDATVGAGAVVVSDVRDEQIVIGNPAKPFAQ